MKLTLSIIRFQKLVLACALLLVTAQSYGQLDASFANISTVYQGNPVLINSPQASMTVTKSAPYSVQNDLAVYNRIEMGVNLQFEEYFANSQKTKVRLFVERWDAANNPLADTIIHLNCNYDPFTDSTYQKAESARFTGTYKMTITVDSIYVDGVLNDTLPANIYINGEIIAQRVSNYTGQAVSSLTAAAISCSGATEGILVEWPSVFGAIEYQLEWLHVNNYGITSTAVIPETQLKYNFRTNSTRISTSDTEYKLSMVFDQGWVLFRVRPIGVSTSDPNQLIYGLWSAPESGVVSSVSSKFEIDENILHEGGLNWQYSATYAEEGKRKEVVSYFDGSLRNRQTVTQVNSDKNVIVGETIYDHQGRPAINVLPTPVPAGDECIVNGDDIGPRLQFYENFNQNVQGAAYSRVDFDLDDPNAACGVAADPMGSQSGSSNYYSPENLNQLDEQAYVPDAKLYPFTQIEYTPDNTGRIRRQSGVGPEFQLGSEHETKYFYGQPNQLELDRLFGSEVGDATHYKKNVVIDAHGQASISYLDQEGRVIATSLAGTAPANLHGIKSSVDEAVPLTVNAFGDNNALNKLSVEGDAMVFSTSLLVPFESDYSFSYSFVIAPFEDECLPDLCIDCVYDLKLELIDECGLNLFPTELESKVVGSFEDDGQGNYMFHGVCSNGATPNQGNEAISVSNLKPGSYMLTKRLTLNQDAKQAYFDLYLDSTLNDCLLTFYDFLVDELANIDSSLCDPTCEECLENLGTLEDYLANGMGSANDYYLQQEDCDRICEGNDYSFCKAAYDLMLQDVSPGGQYGQYVHPTTGSINPSVHPVSVYNTSNELPESNAFWTLPKYIDEYGSHPVYYDENGDSSKIYISPDGPNTWLPAVANQSFVKLDPITNQHYVYPQHLANLEDFVNAFENSWAQSLVFYHPEYCYYESCIKHESPVYETDAFTSDDFDDLLNASGSFEQAIENGLISPNYGTIFGQPGNPNPSGPVLTNWFAPANNDPTSDEHAWDPFAYNHPDYEEFFGQGSCNNFRQMLLDSFTNYRVIGGQSRSMMEVAAYTVRCGNNFYSNPSASCFNFGGPVSGSYDISVLDQEWELLKALYRSVKQSLLFKQFDCIAVEECKRYGGCIGNEDYNSFNNPLYIFTIPPIPFFQQQYNQITSQPCNRWNKDYYTSKTRRFSPVSDFVPIQDANQAAYEVYLQTGQCPVTFSFQHLLSALAADQNLDQNGLSLNSYSELTALFMAANDYSLPGTIPQLYQDVTVSGNNLTVEWMHNPPQANPFAVLTLNLPGGSGLTWDDLTSIIHVYPNGGGFTAEGVYDTGSGNAVTPLTGTITNFNLSTCSFNNVGTTNDLGYDFQELLSTLASFGLFTSVTDVPIDPMAVSGGNITGLETNLIVNAAGLGTGLNWISLSPNTFILHQAGGPTNEGLLLSFESSDPSGFNWADLNLVTHFTDIVSTGSHTFSIVAHLNNGSTVTLFGDLIQQDGSNGQTGVPVGDFGLPIPAECQTTEHEAFRSLFAILKEIASNGGITSNIDLYSSIHGSDALYDQFDAGVSATSSTYDSNTGQITIEAGDCEIILQEPTGMSFANLLGITAMDVSGTANNNFHYSNFTFTGSFSAGSGVSYADVDATSTCLNLQACDACPKDAITIEQNDTIRAQEIASGILIPDVSFQRYDEYVELIDSFNMLHNFSPGDSLYIEAKPYSYFVDNGFEFPSPSYFRFVESAVMGADDYEMIREPQQYVAIYGYGTNVLFEYERYTASIDRYNIRANSNGAPQLTAISQDDFVTARVARNLGIYINYIETRPVGTSGASDILTYLNADLMVLSADEQLYQQYVLAYKQFDSLQQVNPTCEDYLLIAPLYSFDDVLENNLFCTTQGQQLFADYIASFSSGDCPDELPQRRNCSSAELSINKRAYQRWYILYREIIEAYNNSYWATQNGDFLSMAFPTFQGFLNSDYKFCIKAYRKYLKEWTIANQANDPAIPPLPIEQFGPCVGTIRPVDPCRESFNQYQTCNKLFVQWSRDNQYPYTISAFYEYEAFKLRNMCDCVDEYCARLQEIQDGLVSFNSQSEFNYYLSFRIFCEQPCNPGQQSGLPPEAVVVELVDDCLEMQNNQANFTAQLNYENYLTELLGVLNDQYTEHCMQIQEDFKYKYLDKSYHFTLYYYDQAGNLIKTIPPEGVERLAMTSSDDQLALDVSADRLNGTHLVYTSHRLPTRYEYNSLNQLVAQSSPDTDPMQIFDVSLPNGLNSKLITRTIQMVNESRGYLAGEIPSSGVYPKRGLLYQTNDGGATWQRIYKLAGTDLKKSVMYDNNNGIAIGSKGIVLITKDGGNSWDMIDFWAMMNSAEDLNDVIVHNNGGQVTAIVVGNKGLIARSINFGAFADFNGGAIPASYDISSITFDAGSYYLTANDGSQASIFTNPFSNSGWVESNNFGVQELSAVSITNNKRVVAGGVDGRLYVNPDFTSPTNRWQLLHTNTFGDISDLDFFNEQQGLALIDNYLYQSVDGGENWQQFGVQQYAHLCADDNQEILLAVGENARLDIFVPSGNLATPSIPVANNFSANVTAGWVDKDGSEYMLVVATADGKLHHSYNAHQSIPGWLTTDVSSALQSGELIIDLKIHRDGTNSFKGVALTNQERVLHLNGSNTLSYSVVLTNTKALAYNDGANRVFAFRNGGDVKRIRLLNGVVNNAGNATTPNAAVLKAGAFCAVGTGIELIPLNGNNAGTASDQSTKTNPLELEDIAYYPNANVLTAVGGDGVLYQSNGANWAQVRTSSNKTFYASTEADMDMYVVGEAGYMSKGMVSGPQFFATPSLLNSSIAVEDQINDDLFDINISAYGAYAVGANGRVIYSPVPAVLNFGSLQHGSDNIYGVSTRANGVYSVGANSSLHFISGASFIRKKDLYTAPLKDVHFVSSSVGTLVAEGFTVRKTTDGGLNWSTVVPNQFPLSGGYSHVWTIDAQKAMVFGTGLPMEALLDVAQAESSGPQNVKDVARFNNRLLIVNGAEVVRMNVNNNNFNPHATLGAVANAIRVLPNGSFGVAGDNGYFQYFNPSGNNSPYSANSADFNNTNPNFNDLFFVDNGRIVLVGDEGAYWESSQSQYNNNGLMNNTVWFQQDGVFTNDPYFVDAANKAHIYSIAFTSAKEAIYGGEYTANFVVSGLQQYSFVRRVYTPAARYSARFYYDRLGREVVSQNARQYNSPDKKYSYTLYDALGRVVEVGEKTETNSGTETRFKNVFGTTIHGHFNPSVIDDMQLEAWVNNSGERREVTKSYYDFTVLSGLPANFTPNPLTQRKRITHVTYEEAYDGNDQTYDHATHYDYDIHGNVKTLLQDNRKMATEFPSIASQRYKRMDYSYDLVSGNVHRMSVQTSEADQWHHAYKYDADNRIISAHTNTETPLVQNAVIAQYYENELTQNTDWQQEAKYIYYDHGPLARVELGTDGLQGIDYVYNVQGWLKGVNATSLDENSDPGKDALAGSVNAPFAKDVYGYSLHYFNSDYTAINGTGQNHAASIAGSDVEANSSNLYNGNIRAMQTTLTHPLTREVMPMANAYQYDQLNRLLESRSFINLTGNQWGNTGTYDNRYFNSFEYDGMGNILHQNRYKQDGTQIEDMSYQYQYDLNGNLLRNRLYHINDVVASNVDAADIDDMGMFDSNINTINQNNNYVYDEEGRLVKDLQEEIDQIVWRVDGKVKQVIRSSGSDKKNLTYDYDAMGNRIAKHVFDSQTNMLEKSTYYVLDAQGNQLSIYEHEVENSGVSYTLKERNIYGSSHLGTYNKPVNMYSISQEQNTTQELGWRYYGLQEHRGNVLTVINDIKTPLSSGTTVESYQVGIVNIADYSGFGVELDDRTIKNGKFRRSFQGQEADSEVFGESDYINFKYRGYDPRVARFSQIDPLAPKYPYNSPYAFSENVVINAVELEGLERRYTFNSKFTTQKFFKIYEQYQKGTKTFDDLRKYLDSRTGYRMGEEATRVAKSRLEGGDDADDLGLDDYQGVPYIATDKDVANDNYLIVSYIVETKDGNYDRESFEIVKSGYAPDMGVDTEKMKNNESYDPLEGGHDSANLGTLSNTEKTIVKKTGEFLYYAGQLALELVQKVMLPIIVEPIIYPNTTQSDQPLMSVNAQNE